MTELNQVGSIIRMVDINKRSEQLEKGVYLLDVDMSGFYLVEKENFELPKKIYGEHNIINRWKTSFEENTEKNMGIILSGIKGSGKTITAQKFCMETDLPVILITQPYKGTAFVDFITNKVLGKCIIFIDEYEKVYDLDKDSTISNDLLSIMDGQYPTKLIFLLTVNTFNINPYLINRLNRLKYKKEYTSLEDDVIEAVIDDMLIHKEHKDSILEVFEVLNMTTFDLLVNIIKEVNLFNEPAHICASHLNLEITPAYYKIEELLPNGGSSIVGYRFCKFDEDETINVYRSDRTYYTENNIKIDDSIELEFDDEDLVIEKTGRRTKLVKTQQQARKFIPMDGPPKDKDGRLGGNYTVIEEGRERHYSPNTFNNSYGYFEDSYVTVDVQLQFTKEREKVKKTF